MPFDLSVTKPLETQPWRYTTQPNPDGTGGVKVTLDGAFVLLDDNLIAYMQEAMTAAQKAEIAPWVNRYTVAECAMWNVPLWSGQTGAVYLRVPAVLWARATAMPPAKIKRFFARLYRDAA